MTEAESHTLLGTVDNLSTKLMAALPAPFLLLCLINVGFLYFVMNFLSTQMEARTQMANKLIDACIAEQQIQHPKPSAAQAP